MKAMEVAFFVCAGLVVYHYLIYPAAVIAIARRFPRETRLTEHDALPSVTVLIAAYNEQRVIADKIENTLSLDYPADKLQVVIAADGSSDATADIARRYTERGVMVLHQPARRGKTAALNRGVRAATGDIVVFSDANNHFSDDALRQLVRHFGDSAVGGVCGRKQIYAANDRESSVGDGLYWKYESAIKLAESRLGSITTADGEIFAVRRELYRPIDERQINDDTAITFELVQQGYCVLYEPAARSWEHASITIEDDFHVKVRMVCGGFQTIARYWRFLLASGGYGIAFLSHKLLRWLAPELLLVVALSSVLLSARPFFFAAALLQASFYALAIAGWFARGRARVPLLLYVPLYFSAMNLAAFFGLVRFLSGRRSTLWRKAAR